MVPRCTDALAINRVTEGTVLALAGFATLLTIPVEGTSPGAGLTRPPCLTLTLPSPRVTFFSAVLFTRTNLRAASPILVGRTGRYGAVSAQPTFLAETPAADMGADGSIEAGTPLSAVHAKCSQWTLFLALVAYITGGTLAAASLVVTLARVVTVTELRAVVAPCPLGAGVGTHIARPSRRTAALASDRITVSTILALAFVAAGSAMGALRT